MKKGILLIVFIFIVQTVHAQQQKGDSELQLNGFITSVNGDALGSAQLKLGQFLTDHFQIGITPSVFIQTGGFSDVTFGGGAFLNYSFLASDAKTVPYFGASYRKQDLEEWEFDNGNVGAELGFKQFVTSKTAFDISGNYLIAIPVGEQEWDFENGLIYLSFGFSYLF